MEAEHAIRRRIRARCGYDVPTVCTPHRGRTVRRIRRMFTRSRSTGSCTRERIHTNANQRSTSYPDYPVYSTNTYKITENSKDYIFEVKLPYSKNHNSLQSASSIHYFNQNSNLYYQSSYYQNHVCHNEPNFTKLQTSNENDLLENTFTNIKRRRLPKIDNIRYRSQRCLPSVPSLETNVYTITDNTLKSDKFVKYNKNIFDKNILNNEKEINILCNQNEVFSPENIIIVSGNENKFSSYVGNKIDNINSGTNLQEQKLNNNIKTNFICNNIRKKFLSLDLKSNYECKSLKKIKSLEFSEPLQKYENLGNENEDTCNKYDNTLRRYSDSYILPNVSPDGASSPDAFRSLFKTMKLSLTNCKSSSAKKTSDLNETDKSIGTKKHYNVVSINEIPTYQEYSSPKTISSQPSFIMSTKRPLPSIIKKARPRSYSLACTDHLGKIFSTVANCQTIALSPSNLGSPGRALAPVASYLQMDDLRYDDHPNHRTTTTEQSTADNSTVDNTSEPTRSACNQSDTINHKNRRMITNTKKCENRKPKHSNDYGGRDNGRNNHQQQPLERRESRRGQFTRSLSNADVPPEEKGNNNI